MEFLRVCQREGIFRLERDRRGQIRVFSGSALQATPIATASAAAAIEQQLEANGNVYEGDVSGDAFNSEPIDTREGSDTGDRGTDSVSVQVDADREAEEPIETAPPVADVIEIEETRAPAKPRRTRKAPTAGKPAARKSTGARTSAPKRRKTPVPA